MHFEKTSDPDECVLTYLIKLIYNFLPEIGERCFDKDENNTMISFVFPNTTKQ